MQTIYALFMCVGAAGFPTHCELFELTNTLEACSIRLQAYNPVAELGSIDTKTGNIRYTCLKKTVPAWELTH